MSDNSRSFKVTLKSEEIGKFLEFGINDGFLDDVYSAKSIGDNAFEFEMTLVAAKPITDEELEAFLMRYADWKGDR